MKTRFTLLGWSLLLLSICSGSSPAQIDKVNSATSIVQPVEDIAGVWAFVSNVGEPPSMDKKIKIIADGHWMFSQPNPADNITSFHHGGTYTLEGDSYAETIEYANASTGGYLGRTFKYKIAIEGDTMTLTGPYNEVWKRVK